MCLFYWRAYPSPNPRTYNDTPSMATSRAICKSADMAAIPPVYELLQKDTVNVPSAIYISSSWNGLVDVYHHCAAYLESDQPFTTFGPVVWVLRVSEVPVDDKGVFTSTAARVPFLFIRTDIDSSYGAGFKSCIIFSTPVDPHERHWEDSDDKTEPDGAYNIGRGFSYISSTVSHRQVRQDAVQATRVPVGMRAMVHEDDIPRGKRLLQILIIIRPYQKPFSWSAIYQ